MRPATGVRCHFLAVPATADYGVADLQTVVQGGTTCAARARKVAEGEGGGEVTRIVVLNGVGSVGKSSLARALQARSRLPLLHVAMDGFLEMLPEALRDHPSGISYVRTPIGVEVRVGPAGARLLAGMLEAVAALAWAGCDLVFDTVMDREATIICRARLTAFDTAHVGLVAPLTVIEAREVQRGDRLIGLARAQFGRVHVGIDDDLTLDMTVLAPETAAQAICERFGL